MSHLVVFFFFQAEDGIRDVAVTGVQTCALPIYGRRVERDEEGYRVAKRFEAGEAECRSGDVGRDRLEQIGRASCRERSVDLGGRRIIKKKKKKKTWCQHGAQESCRDDS